MFDMRFRRDHREHASREQADQAPGDQATIGREEALLCPLTMAPIGKDLRLCQLCKGRRMARRLAELGLTPGVNLRIVQDAGGPLLVSVRNSRVALGRGIADKLTVQVLDTHSPDRQAKPFVVSGV